MNINGINKRAKNNSQGNKKEYWILYYLYTIQLALKQKLLKKKTIEKDITMIVITKHKKLIPEILKRLNAKASKTN